MTVAELNAFVRFTLGGLTTDIIDDATLDQIIQNVLDTGLATTDCQEKFYSVKQTLIYLDTQSAAESAGTGAAGAIKLIEETIGKRKIRKEWDTSGNTGASTSWKGILEDFLADPQDYLLCDPFPSAEDGSGAVIIGVSTKKYTHSSPWRCNLNKGLNNPTWKY